MQNTVNVLNAVDLDTEKWLKGSILCYIYFIIMIKNWIKN